ncbi:abortive infection family protein [uncultured Psychromonas sp.]|uniref:abortive infection family protein n=1 Tax=uncultured Psychromonas sp. TaxID=173974 RepID=UPI00262CCEE6|nr:abortive infection family protein [uncultured Psychromonas sp.]
MTDTSFKLQLSTKAIVGSEGAIHLIEQKERLEAAARKTDAPLCLDLSKAFLETVFKTILNDRVEGVNQNEEFGPLYKQVKNNVEFSRNDDINNLLSLLAGQIVNVTGQLRNRYGAASHGDDGYRDNPIDMPSAEFIMSSVDGLASCLYTKHKDTVVAESAQRMNYVDFSDFNEWFDDQNDIKILMGEDSFFSFSASQILFDQDIEAYREVLLQYESNLDENE